jgi:hypothetical protein
VAIRFVATNFMIVTSEGGVLGRLMTPLVFGATNESQTVGFDSKSDSTVEVSAAGQYVLGFSQIEIDGQASSVGNDLRLQDYVESGLIVDENIFCTRFRAELVEPIQVSLDYSDTTNSCIGVRITDPNGALPPLDNAQLNACRELMATILEPPP